MAAGSFVDPTTVLGSVFYIHPSDNSNTKLVNDLFDGSGYNNWKRTMMLGISSRNKLGFIDGSVPQPPNTDRTANAWQRCNDLVVGWLLFSLDKKIAKSVWFYKTAYEIWKDLEERFGQTSATQLYSLQQELIDIKQGRDEPVTEFFTRIKTVWDAIDCKNPLPVCSCGNCSCGVSQKIIKSQQDQRLMMFLIKLDDKFGMVRTNILMMQPFPTISLAHRLYRKRFFDRQADKGYKQYSGSNNGQPIRNQVYNGKGQTGKRLSNWYCDHSKMAGHGIERCFKLNGFPPGWTGNAAKARTANLAKTDGEENADVGAELQVQMSNDQYNQYLAFIGKQEGSATDLDDSQTAGYALFADKTITIPDGKRVKNMHIGTVRINDDILLQDVLHVPGFQFNLISVHKLCKDMNCGVNFTANTCTIQGPHLTQPLVLGDLRDGLYCIQAQ
uniref:Retrotransposon Copia-like N-terminal domain-containing protein n=1 Tax=Chenopodium quinoa TaxID=63459 RepID=A0A803MB71_CHEQI